MKRPLHATGEGPPNQSPPLLLTVEEAAHLLNMSTRTVRRLIDVGELQVVRLNRSVRVTRSPVESMAQPKSLTKKKRLNR